MPGRPFAPGHSGNPRGRKKIPPDVKSALEALVPDAIRCLKRIVKSKSSGPVQTKAAEIILDRVFGRPAQQVQHTGADGGVMRIEVVYVSKANGHE
jgi:hypothetical protein